MSSKFSKQIQDYLPLIDLEAMLKGGPFTETLRYDGLS